jgi:hypothetical protein
VIHYHGGPITPQTAAIALWTRRHAMVSFARPDQMALAAEICQSFALDNGAFSLWRAGEGVVDVVAFADWVRQWERHPGYDFALIPDAIDGDEAVNDGLIARWHAQRVRAGVPVWHLHERLERLDWLVRCTESRVYPLVALGSSGAFAKIGTDAWWGRIAEAMTVACDDEGRPRCRLHGLRMLAPTVFAHLPLASADSCNVARNVGLDKRWRGPYEPVTPSQRALVLAERIELIG